MCVGELGLLLLKPRGFEAEVFLNADSNFVAEAIGERRKTAARFVQGQPLDALHGVEDGGQANGAFFVVEELLEEILEGAEVNTPHGHPGGIKPQ